MRIKIDTDKLPFLFLCLYIIVSCAFGYTRIQQIFLVSLVVSTLVFSVYLRNFHIGKFGSGYIMMTIWSGIQLYFGLCYDYNSSVEMFRTLCINCLFIISLYTVLYNSKNIIRNIERLIVAFFITLIVIFIGSGSSLLSGRLALSIDGVSFSLGPLVSSISPNEVSLWCAMAFLMSMLCMNITKKRKYLIYCGFFLIGNLLAASRKGMIALIIGFLIYYIFSADRPKRYFKWIISIALGVLVVILLFTNNTLYQMAGYRLEELFNMFFYKTADVNIVGGSLRTRAALLEYAQGYIKDNAILGYGINSFKAMCPLHIVTDNNYYEMLVAGGIIGFSLYYLPLLLIVIDLAKIKKRDKFFYFIISVLAMVLVSDFTCSSYYLRITLMPYVLLDAFTRYYIRVVQENDNHAAECP